MADSRITQYHGDTWILPVAVTAGGVAVNLTGATICFELETESATVADFYFSDPASATPDTVGISISRQDALGTFTITLTAALMGTLEPNADYSWDITCTSAGGTVTTYIPGLLSVEGKCHD